MNKVGQKGQVVISKEIRDKLGVEPGWLALQSIVDNYVKIYFVPPEHNRSLLGSLKEFIPPGAGEGLSWEEMRELAWAEAVKERESGGKWKVD